MKLEANLINKKSDKPVILIVDDTPENIDVLKGALISNYIVKPTTNGRVALQVANITPTPDLILLDIMMPEMDGYEVCRRLKANQATQDIPVIFITAKSEIDDEIEGLRLGAVDYITKPFSIPIVLSRVKTHLTLRAAQRKLDEQNQHLLREREMIENIVLKMRDQDHFDERHLRFLISPVEETAGDMLLSAFTPDGRQLVLLGDFTGHGLTAAIGGPLVTYFFYDLAQRDFSGENIFSKLNEQLHAKLPIGVFFAAALVEINQERTSASIWNAAIPVCMLFRNGAMHKQVQSALPPLGIMSSLNTVDSVTNITLEKMDRIVVCSDGIVESMGSNGEMFGNERLQSFLENISTSNGELKDLISVLTEFTGTQTFDDDITLVEIEA